MQLVLVVIALFILAMIAITLIVSALIFLAMAAAIGIPLYLVGKHWMGKQGISTTRLTPMERLKSMYIEGKIDLFEFEQRVAKLLTIEH